jgi:DNA-binding CsgD family transcriptional regulator
MPPNLSDRRDSPEWQESAWLRWLLQRRRGIAGEPVPASPVHCSRDPAEQWRAFVAGRWALADSFEHEGHRYVVVHRNAPVVAAEWTKRLTPRERSVALLAALGYSNKEIAYELGVATSAVSAYLCRVMRKLGATSRVALILWVRRSAAAPASA